MGSDKLKWNVVKDRFLAQQAEHNAQINAHTGQKRRPDDGFVALARIGTSADKFDVKRYNREQFLVRTPRVPSPAGRGLCPRHGVNAARRKAAPKALPTVAFAACARDFGSKHGRTARARSLSCLPRRETRRFSAPTAGTTGANA